MQLLSVLKLTSLLRRSHSILGWNPQQRIYGINCGSFSTDWKLFLLPNYQYQQYLRSVDSPMLLVPSTRRTTLGDRVFPVVAAKAWNSLPPQIRTASSLPTFRRQNKTYFFCQSYGWFKSIVSSILLGLNWTWTCVFLTFKLCKVPPQLFCDGVTIILTFVVAVLVVVVVVRSGFQSN